MKIPPQGGFSFLALEVAGTAKCFQYVLREFEQHFTFPLRLLSTF